MSDNHHQQNKHVAEINPENTILKAIDIIINDDLKLNILYLNGFKSKLNDSKKEILQSYGNLTAPYVDHHNEENIYLKYANIVINEKIDLIIGSSMGGALGFLLSSNFNIPALLFNPAVPYYDGELIPTQKVTAFQKCVIGNLDTIILPSNTLSFLRENNSPNISIKVLNDLAHQIPLTVFEKEIDIFMKELFEMKKSI